MEAQPKLNFVRAHLPWIIASAAFVIYLFTLNRWVSMGSLPVVAQVAGWDWWQLHLQEPLSFLLTYPMHWVPAAWLPLAMNGFAALCAAATLGLLARSVSLLPHNRTHEQRLRESHPQALLSIPAAWVPPVLAACACAFQLTFWENATAATGEALNLLLFAYIVRCLLEFRLDPRDGWLYRAALVYGLGLTNNWAFIAYFPLFVAALIWLKRVRFFQGRFLLVMMTLGVMGLWLYLLLPLTEVLAGKTSLTFGMLLKLALVYQRDNLLHIPNWVLLVSGISSLVPLLLMSFRWPGMHGDTNLGDNLTRLFFSLAHVLFLALGLAVVFDPPFSPRAVGQGVSFITFYYLTALNIGYLSGYVLLVFGKEPNSKMYKRPSLLIGLAGKGLVLLTWLALVLTPAGLIYKNLPTIHTNNGSLLLDLARRMAQSLPTQGAVVISDEPFNLLLLEAQQANDAIQTPLLTLDTRYLKYAWYHSNLVHRFPQRWQLNPALITENGVIDSPSLINLLMDVTTTNEVYYLHPSFGYYFEGLCLQPRGLVYRLTNYTSDALQIPVPSAPEVASNQAFWNQLKPELGKIPKPSAAEAEDFVITELEYVDFYYSRALNYWGVELQKSGHFDAAAPCFQQAIELVPMNVAALINQRYNRAHANKSPVKDTILDDRIEELLRRYRNWDSVLLNGGPVDDPRVGVEIGKVFMSNSLFRQAAHQFLRVKDLAPDDFENRVQLANLYFEVHKPEDALALVRETKALLASHPLPHANPSELIRLEAAYYRATTNYTAAVQLLQTSLRQAPKDEILTEALTQTYMAAGDYTNGMAEINQLLKLNPDNIRALLNQGALYIQFKSPAEAIPPLSRVLQLQPQNRAARLNRAIALLQKGQWDAAQKDYEDLLKAMPNSFAVLFGLGEIAYQRKDTKKAIDYYNRFLSNVPPNIVEIKQVNERLKALGVKGDKP